MAKKKVEKKVEKKKVEKNDASNTVSGIVVKSEENTNIIPDHNLIKG